VTASQFQQVEPLPARPRGLGCGTILLLGLGIPLFVFLGTAAGLLCYGLAWAFGTPSVGVSIAAGVIAFVIVCLATPFGLGLGCLLLPEHDQPMVKNAIALIAILVGPFVFYMEVLFLAVPAGIGAGLMFYWCQPLLASILLGVLPPLAGLGIGLLLVAHVGDNIDGGNNRWGRRDGLFHAGNDGVEIGGDGAGGGDDRQQPNGGGGRRA